MKNTNRQNLELFAQRYVNSFREIEGLFNLTKEQIYDGVFDEVQRVNYNILEKLFQASAYEEMLLAMTDSDTFPDIDAVLDKYYYQIRMRELKGLEESLKRIEEDKIIVKKFKGMDLYYLCRGDYILGEQTK